MAEHRKQTKSARDRYGQLSNFDTLDQNKVIELFRIQTGVSQNKPTVSLVYEGNPQQTLDYTFLLDLPELAQPMLQILGSWGSKNARSPITRLNARDHLKMGFYKYLLSTNNLSITIGEINNSLIHKFSLWLDQKTNTKGVPLSVGTKRQYRERAIHLVQEFMRDPRYSKKVDPSFNPGESPWRNRELFNTPTRCLSDIERDKLLSVCAQEIQKTISIVGNFRSKIAGVKLTESQINNLSPKELGQNFDLCLAAINIKYLGIVPPLEQIMLDSRKLGNACTNIIYRRQTQSINDTVICFQPNLDQLVPFILYLSLHTGFNTSVLLGLRISDIRKVDVFGTSRLQLQGMKDRGSSIQRKSFPITGNPLDVATIIQFLLDWSQRIRPHVTVESAAFLFLYVSARDFTPADFHSKPTAWMKALAAFRKRHDLELFGLRELRQTYLEQVRQIFNDNPLIVKQAAGHRNIQTQRTHYNNDQVRQRQSEHLGLLIDLQDRWIGSQGLINPEGLWAKDQDIGAATLGFHCLDPFQSPQAGQHEGRLCDAYGACTICPLAIVNPASARALTRLLQLKKSIEDAQTSLDSRRWLVVWAPRLEQLNKFWLPAFKDPQVIQDASTLSLPDLPPLRDML